MMTKKEIYQILMAQSKIYSVSSPRLEEAFIYAAELVLKEIQEEELDNLNFVLKEKVAELEDWEKYEKEEECLDEEEVEWGRYLK